VTAKRPLDGEDEESVDAKRRRILAETRDIDADDDSEEDEGDSDDDDDSDDDSDAELQRELDRVRREREEKKKKEVRLPDKPLCQPALIHLLGRGTTKGRGGRERAQHCPRKPAAQQARL
jgi:hypothetical protein